MARKHHLRRGGVVAHADALQHSRHYLYQFLFGKRPVEVGMRTCQRLVLENFFNNLARLCNLASIHPLSDQLMQLRQ
ncbi:hypothetical protein DXM22_24400 [Agrobacterium vitis]|nr:hypothetical protein DXM22_24400 [Agrobacterium vitis]